MDKSLLKLSWLNVLRGSKHDNKSQGCLLRWLLIPKYPQNILGMFCLKIEKKQIWLKKMLQYIVT